MSGNKIKVLVLGRTGMLGHMVMRYLGEDPGIRVYGTQMTDNKKPFYLDVFDGAKGVERVFDRIKGADYCINCIGLTANKIVESDPLSVKKAWIINTGFPALLAETAARYKCRVIHISTDGVFTGTKPFYDELSEPDCRDIYGLSKLKGEIDALNFLTLRCSIIGPSPYEKGGLWEWFGGLPEGTRVNGFSDNIWNGITTLQFAQFCKKIIKTGSFEKLRSVSGVYHYAPNRPLSKYALLKILRKSLGKKVSIVKSLSGKGQLKRILRTGYRDFRLLSGPTGTISAAVDRMCKYERKKNG